MSSFVRRDQATVALKKTQEPTENVETMPKTSSRVEEEAEWIAAELSQDCAEFKELLSDDELRALLEERVEFAMFSEPNVEADDVVDTSEVDMSESSLQVLEAGRIEPEAVDEGSVLCALNSSEASLSSTLQPLQVEVPNLIGLAESKVKQGVVGLLKTKSDIPPVSRTLMDMKWSNLEPLKNTRGVAAYLRDPIVNYWFETRTEKEPGFAALDTNLYNERQWPRAQRQLQELFERGVSLVFFPIPDSHHWTLLLLEKHRARHYNSLSARIPPPVTRFCQQLVDLDRPVASLPTAIISLPKQLDSVNCGIFTCLMAEHTMRGSLELWTQELANEEVALWRQKMHAELSVHEKLLKKNEKPIVVADDDSDIEIIDVGAGAKKNNGDFEKVLANVNVLMRRGSLSENTSVSPNTAQPQKPTATGPNVLSGSTKFVIFNLEVATKKPDTSARIVKWIEAIGFSLEALQIQPVQSHPTMCAGYNPYSHFSSFQSDSSLFHGWLQDQTPVQVDNKWTMVLPYTGPKQYPFWLYYFWLHIEVRSSGISIFNRTMWQGENAVEKIVGDVIKSVTKEQAKNALQKLTNKAQRIVKTAATHKDIEWSYWN